MYYIIAIIFVGFVAVAVVVHGARILRIPERKHRAGRFFMLGAALSMFMATVLLLQQSGA